VSVAGVMPAPEAVIGDSPQTMRHGERFRIGIGLTKNLAADREACIMVALPQGEPSRFAGKIALQHEEKLGSAPRTHDALGEQSVDVAESYRLTRNLDVTAGLRYSQQHDRLTSVNGPQDSQAVYVGTQFRF